MNNRMTDDVTSEPTPITPEKLRGIRLARRLDIARRFCPLINKALIESVSDTSATVLVPRELGQLDGSMVEAFNALYPAWVIVLHTGQRGPDSIVLTLK